MSFSRNRLCVATRDAEQQRRVAETQRSDVVQHEREEA